MRTAKRPQNDDRIEYQKAFRKKVFRLLKMGYDRLDAISFKDAEEEDITGEIVRKVNETLEDRGSPRWVSSFSVHEDPSVNMRGPKGQTKKEG